MNIRFAGYVAYKVNAKGLSADTINQMRTVMEDIHSDASGTGTHHEGGFRIDYFHVSDKETKDDLTIAKRKAREVDANQTSQNGIIIFKI